MGSATAQSSQNGGPIVQTTVVTHVMHDVVIIRMAMIAEV